jgi:hypothetical protein
MSFTITPTEPQGLDLPAGVYPGTVQSVTPAEGEFGPQAKFVVTLDNQDADNSEAWAWCSQKISPKSKLARWIKALNAPAYVKGQPYDVEQLAGRRCGVLIERETLPDGSGRCRVKELLPPANGANPQADDVSHCVECFAPLGADGYFTATGEPYCGEHGPRAAS